MRFLGLFDKLQPYMRLFDWAAGIGTLSYGLWRESGWWIAGGVLMLILAWLDPGTRLKRYASFIKPVARNQGSGIRDRKRD
jgi:hypothetical protein